MFCSLFPCSLVRFIKVYVFSVLHVLDFISFILRPFNLSDVFIFYANSSDRAVFSRADYLNIIFNWFNYLMILSIWIRRKKLLNSDVFIITQYFIFTIFLNTLPLPSAFFRYNYYIL